MVAPPLDSNQGPTDYEAHWQANNPFISACFNSAMTSNLPILLPPMNYMV